MSKIFLDKNNALNQIKVLQKIYKKSVSNERLPMLIVDKDIGLNDRNNFNASRAAINGFSLLQMKLIIFLDLNNKINYLNLNNFKKL